MRNYCIINGNYSDELTGLLIQSLPPISKPLMRTQIETIDGRDGDIVTKLGYSAYDKTMTIGLYGSFDIDDVISFFDTEGTIIFSNELDKIYNFTMVNQIDFERLLRFRTATVTLHVQPYKYSAMETPISEENDFTDIRVTNLGNAIAKPTLTIYGSGTISVYLNGSQIFQIAMGSYNNITIDTEEMNAYMGSVLLNRNVTGNYESFSLEMGDNLITVDGAVTQVEITKYSRWI